MHGKIVGVGGVSQMGIAYQCDAAAGCTFIVWDADVTPAEWREREEAMFGDPAFPPGPRALADLRSAGGSPHLGIDVVREMAEHLRSKASTIGPLKFALIPNSGWDKALEFEEELKGSGITSIAFTSLATACTWLGVNATQATATLSALREELRQ